MLFCTGMKIARVVFAALVLFVAVIVVRSSSDAAVIWQLPQISLVMPVNLPGSFVSSHVVYADADRIYLGSFQGSLFILKRDRQAAFPLIQTIPIGSPVAGVRGDKEKLYVSGGDGRLYIFNKTWPVQLSGSIFLSNYGLSALDVAGGKIYVAKGQAAMNATDSRVYLSELNPGDFAVEVNTSRSYGEKEFAAGTTLVFDRQTLQLIGTLPNPNVNHVNISSWGDLVYLTNPGCCGAGIHIYDSRSLKLLQFVNRMANAVAGLERGGLPLLVAGSETGEVALYALRETGYQYYSSIHLRAVTGFTGPEDIEIRALWVDDTDNLAFAASSWGNDSSRGPNLPSFFILEIQAAAEAVPNNDLRCRLFSQCRGS